MSTLAPSKKLNKLSTYQHEVNPHRETRLYKNGILIGGLVVRSANEVIWQPCGREGKVIPPTYGTLLHDRNGTIHAAIIMEGGVMKIKHRPEIDILHGPRRVISSKMGTVQLYEDGRLLGVITRSGDTFHWSTDGDIKREIKPSHPLTVTNAEGRLLVQGARRFREEACIELYLANSVKLLDKRQAQPSRSRIGSSRTERHWFW